MAHDVAVCVVCKAEFAYSSIEAADRLVVFGCNEKDSAFAIGILCRLIGGGILAGIESVVRSFNDHEFFFDDVINLFAELRIVGIGFENDLSVAFIFRADPSFALLFFCYAGICIERVIEKDSHVAAGEFLFVGNGRGQVFIELDAGLLSHIDVIERISKSGFFFVAESADEPSV